MEHLLWYSQQQQQRRLLLGWHNGNITKTCI
jgi:hypothetical protein